MHGRNMAGAPDTRVALIVRWMVAVAVMATLLLVAQTGTAPAAVPQSFFSVDTYAKSQNLYAPDLDQFNTKWWSGGVDPSDIHNQIAMLRNGYHFLPTFNTGYFMRSQRLTDAPAWKSRAEDPVSCLTKACPLKTSTMLSEAREVQEDIGDDGDYYAIGDEPDDRFSDGVSPSVFAGQFAAWVKVIKQGDPDAKIVAPGISSVSCCNLTLTQPWGTAGRWFRSFVAAYKHQNGGAKPPIDVLAMHLYNYDPRTSDISATQANHYLSEVRSFRREADSLGYSGVPIWITEMGFVGESEPLTRTESSQITHVLTQLATNASALNLQRLFLFTDNTHPVLAIDRLDPLFAPTATSKPTSPMPLTDYGRLVADLATGTRPPSNTGSSSGRG